MKFRRKKVSIVFFRFIKQGKRCLQIFTTKSWFTLFCRGISASLIPYENIFYSSFSFAGVSQTLPVLKISNNVLLVKKFFSHENIVFLIVFESFNAFKVISLRLFIIFLTFYLHFILLMSLLRRFPLFYLEYHFFMHNNVF